MKMLRASSLRKLHLNPDLKIEWKLGKRRAESKENSVFEEQQISVSGVL